MKKYYVPALVMGSGRTLLGTIRCLGVSGIPAYGITDPSDFAASSRWCRLLPSKFGSVPAISMFGSFLDHLPFKEAVLIPCSDLWSIEAAALPDYLKKRFYLCQSKLEVQKYFVDKGCFRALLKRHSIPHPKTYHIENEHNLKRLLCSLQFDDGTKYFLKPKISAIFSSHFKVKGFFIDSEEDAINKYRIARKAGCDMLLQEYILGPPSNHYYVEGLIDRKGGFPVIFARQRLRMYPPKLGNSSAFKSIPVKDIAPAVEMIITLLGNVGYRGIYSAEFKLDERDGVYKLIEINARCWWYIEFLERCKVNIPEMAYRDALGFEVQGTAKYSTDVKAVDIIQDVRAVFGKRLAKGFNFWQWLESWLVDKHTVLSSRDPIPVFFYFFHIVKKVFFSKKDRT